jgi:uncharacterized protein YfkK (UPF0435 family)
MNDVDKNNLDLVSFFISFQIMMFKNEIEEKRKTNNFFFLKDNWIFGYIFGVCSLTYELWEQKQKPSFKLSYLNVYVLQNINFLGKKEEDLQAFTEMILKLKSNFSDFAESIAIGKEDIISFKKNKKNPATLYEYLSNIFDKK